MEDKIYNISEIKYALRGGGYRPALFRVFITNPINGASTLDAPLLVKASGLPEMTLGSVPVFYMGRPIKLRGDRVFQPWSVTILNDTDFEIRNGLEEWNNAMNLLEGNRSDLLPEDYKSEAQIQALDSDGNILREYTMKGIWPVQISPIRTDWAMTDTVSEFDVVFELDSWAPTGGTSNSYGVE